MKKLIPARCTGRVRHRPVVLDGKKNLMKNTTQKCTPVYVPAMSLLRLRDDSVRPTRRDVTVVDVSAACTAAVAAAASAATKTTTTTM